MRILLLTLPLLLSICNGQRWEDDNSINDNLPIAQPGRRFDQYSKRRGFRNNNEDSEGRQQNYRRNEEMRGGNRMEMVQANELFPFMGENGFGNQMPPQFNRRMEQINRNFIPHNGMEQGGEMQMDGLGPMDDTPIEEMTRRGQDNRMGSDDEPQNNYRQQERRGGRGARRGPTGRREMRFQDRQGMGFGPRDTGRMRRGGPGGARNGPAMPMGPGPQGDMPFGPRESGMMGPGPRGGPAMPMGPGPQGDMPFGPRDSGMMGPGPRGGPAMPMGPGPQGDMPFGPRDSGMMGPGPRGGSAMPMGPGPQGDMPFGPRDSGMMGPGPRGGPDMPMGPGPQGDMPFGFRDSGMMGPGPRGGPAMPMGPGPQGDMPFGPRDSGMMGPGPRGGPAMPMEPGPQGDMPFGPRDSRMMGPGPRGGRGPQNSMPFRHQREMMGPRPRGGPAMRMVPGPQDDALFRHQNSEMMGPEHKSDETVARRFPRMKGRDEQQMTPEFMPFGPRIGSRGRGGQRMGYQDMPYGLWDAYMMGDGNGERQERVQGQDSYGPRGDRKMGPRRMFFRRRMENEMNPRENNNFPFHQFGNSQSMMRIPFGRINFQKSFFGDIQGFEKLPVYPIVEPPATEENEEKKEVEKEAIKEDKKEELKEKEEEKEKMDMKKEKKDKNIDQYPKMKKDTIKLAANNNLKGAVIKIERPEDFDGITGSIIF